MRRAAIAASCLWIAGVFAQAQTPASPPSPASQRIEWAEAAIRKNPAHFQPYNDLAAALLRRASDTSDPRLYDRADSALATSLRLAHDNFDAGKLKTEVLLGRHQFAEALDLARSLNARLPDDVTVYGLLAEASIEVGEYDEAEKAAQFMFDLRPPTAHGFVLAGRLRELFGDTDGAGEFLESAYRLTPQADRARRAVILAERAGLALGAGKVDVAAAYAQEALTLAPDHVDALARLADVRAARNRHADAVDLWRRVEAAAPHPRTRHALAQALDRAGRRTEARRAYLAFEQQALAVSGRPDNANRELAAYYAGPGRKPAEATRIARLELARRQDVRTLAVAAAALHANGEFGEARTHIRKALAVGISDAGLLCAASTIERSLNNRREAARYLRQSLQVNPASRCAVR